MKFKFTAPKMKARRIPLLLTLMSLGVFTNASAQYLNVEKFDNVVPISTSQTANSWYIDRYAPDGFGQYNFNGSNVLRIQIGQDGAQANRGTRGGGHYNTQGRTYDLGEKATVITGDLYIPADWATKHRRSDIWGVGATKAAPTTPSLYPIIGFANTEGNNPTLRYWDSENGVWVNIPQTITYDTWYSFKIAVDGSSVKYYVNDVKVGTVSAANTEFFKSIIMQGFNFADAVNLPLAEQDLTSNATYDIYWDNIGSVPSIKNTGKDLFYTSIQDAISGADAINKTITVAPGVYNEVLNINKSVSLLGAKAGIDPRPSKSSTRTIDGADESIIATPGNTSALTILANNVTVNGFQFKHSTTSGSADLIQTYEATPTKNITLAYNIVTSATDEGMQIRNSDSLTIDKNYVVNTKGDGINVCQNLDGVAQVVSNNEVANSLSDYGGIYLYDVSNVKVFGNYIHGASNGLSVAKDVVGSSNIHVYDNDIASSFTKHPYPAYLMWISGQTDNVLVENNKFRSTSTSGHTSYLKLVWMEGNPSNVTFNQNLFDVVDRPYFEIPATVTNTINASCNWFGTNNVNTVKSKISGAGAASLSFEPMLTAGTNNSTSYGFAQTTSTCGTVKNINTGIAYTTLSSAFTAATAGDSLFIYPGEHVTGNLTINKSLTILGNNAGIDAVNGTRGAETIIKDSRWTLTGGTNAKIVIAGFRFVSTASGTGATLGIQPPANTTHHVFNNIFYRHASSASSSNGGAYSFYCVERSAAAGTFVFEGNRVYNNSTTSAYTANNQIYRIGLQIPYNASASNVIRDNAFEYCASAINIAIGDRDTIEGNKFVNNGTQITFSQTTHNVNVKLRNNEFRNSNTTLVSFGSHTYFNTQNFQHNNVLIDMSESTFPNLSQSSIANIKSSNNIINRSANKGYIKWYPKYHVISNNTKNNVGVAGVLNYATDGDSVLIVSGVTDTIKSTINLQSKALKIKAENNNATLVGNVSVTGSYYFKLGSNNTIDGIKFIKTDKNGPQNLILVNGNNVTVANSTFTGKYELGDGEVSRAVEVAGVSNFTFTGNTVKALRQPAYFNGGGTVTNNIIEGTRGFVIESGDINFSGNSFKNNATDISILATVTNPSLYTDIVALSSNNNNAYISDQRHTPAIMGAADAYVSTTGDDQNSGSASKPYRNIQTGIDRILPGRTVNVLAGTFNENLSVNKEISLLGANASINPNTGVRSSESIIKPATSNIAAGNLVEVTANNVTISGFTLNGDNTSLTSGFLGVNGADLDAHKGIKADSNVNNLNVNNNIIENLAYAGVQLYSKNGVVSTGNVIANNKIQNLGTYDVASTVANWGVGVLLYNNAYAKVDNNSILNVRNGIQTGNMYQANTGSADYQVLSNNTIEARRRGIFHNLQYGSASKFTINNNNISAVSNVNEDHWDGILLASLTNEGVNAVNNTINGAAVTVPSQGYEIWNVSNSTNSVIDGGSVTGVDYGVFANNYDGYNTDATNGAFASLRNISINADSVGIKVLDNALSSHANVSLTIDSNVVVNGGKKGIVIENNNAKISNLANLTFANQSNLYIELINNKNDVIATKAKFDIPSPNSLAENLSVANRNAVEAKITDYDDNINLGNVYLSLVNPVVKIKLINSDGNPISGVPVKRLTGTSNVAWATSNANGLATASVPVGTHKFQITYNNTVFVTEDLTLVSDTILNYNVFTSKLVFDAKDNTDARVSGVAAQYYGNNQWRNLGTTNGTAPLSIEVLPGEYDVKGTYNFTSNIKQFNVANVASNVIENNSYLTLITFKGMRSSDTTASLDNMSITYLANGSNRTFGTTSSGTVSKLLYPETLDFTATINKTSKVINTSIVGNADTANATQVIEVYPTQLRVLALGSDYAPISGVKTTFIPGAGIAANTIGTSNSDGAIADYYIFPGQYSFSSTHNHATYTRNISINGDGLNPLVDTLNVWLTKVTVNVKNYDSTLATGKTLTTAAKHLNSSAWFNLPNTTTGTTSRYFLPSVESIDMKLTFNQTITPDFVVPFNSNYEDRQDEIVVEKYLNRIKVNTVTYNNEKVSGVNFNLKFGNKNLNLGNTNSNGSIEYDVFADDNTYQLYSVHNSTILDTINILLSSTSPAILNSYDIEMSKVKFSNNGATQYRGIDGQWKTISSELVLHKGEYDFRFRNNDTYVRKVNINDLKFHKSASIIELKDVNNNLLNIAQLEGGIGNSVDWSVSNVASTADSAIWIDLSDSDVNNDRTYKVYSNNTNTSKTQNVLSNNLFTFNTGEVVLKLEDCNGNGVSGAYNSLNSDTTGADGFLKIENIFTNNYATVTYANSSVAKLINADTIVWKLSNVKITYPGNVKFGKDSANLVFNANQVVNILGGTYQFTFESNNNSQVEINKVTYTIPEGNCNLNLTAVIGRLENVDGIGVPNAKIDYKLGSSAYVAAEGGLTNEYGNTVYFHPSNSKADYVMVYYQNKSIHSLNQQIDRNYATNNNVYRFKLTRLAVKVVDRNGNPIANRSVEVNINPWTTVGQTDANGFVEYDVLYKVAYQLRTTGVAAVSKTMNNLRDTLVLQDNSVTVDNNLDLNIPNVTLYPNPTTNRINLEIPVANSTVEIFSVDGRKLVSKSVEGNFVNFDVANYAAGTYRVIVTMGDKRETLVFVKQ
jgi:hypothetical protein